MGMSGVSKRIGEGFILTVGITPPRPERERFATLFITVMLGAVIVGLGALFLTVVKHIL